MSARDDRRLAAELARVLAGEGSSAEGETMLLARVLRDAANVARLEVTQDEVERALAGALPGLSRPAARVRSRPPRWAGALAIAVVAAVVAVLALPAIRSTPVDVEARATAALPGGGVLHVVSTITSPTGLLPAGGLTTWIDGAGRRERLTRTDSAGVILVEALARPGRYVRYQPGTGSAVAAASCDVVASGCAELTDPVELYRAALLRHGVETAERTTIAGTPAYRFTLPVPATAGLGGSHVSQEVTVDATTFLPRRIVWRDASGTVAVISIGAIERLPRGEVPSGAFELRLPPSTRVRQVSSSGRPVRLLGRRQITVAQIRAAGIAGGWLGSRAGGYPLREVTLYRYTAGDVLRFRYGPLVVWSYTTVVPPELAAGHFSPTKILSMENGTVIHFYDTAGGGLAAERDLPGETVAVIGSPFLKVDLLQAISTARAL
jgi:hypothetical protein